MLCSNQNQLLLRFRLATVYGSEKSWRRGGDSYPTNVYKVSCRVPWFMKIFGNETITPDYKVTCGCHHAITD